MTQHAMLSASSAHRWLNCPPSARLEEKLDKPPGFAAKEGTAAHALAEYKLRLSLGQSSERPVSDYHSDDMEAYTDDYVSYVLEIVERLKQKTSDVKVLIEQKLDFSKYVPEGFGTVDLVLIADGEMHILDFKYGQGVLVEANENPQMMLYALGALEIFDCLYDLEVAHMTIFQPRRENISTYTLPATDLYYWAEHTLKPIADVAFKGQGDFISGDWCRFCKVSDLCRKRAEDNLALTRYEFAKPPLLSDDEIEEILGKLNELNNWANSIKSYALAKSINHGKRWERFKLVESRSNRKYRDESKVEQAALDAGFSDIYQTSLIPLTKMERLMKKDAFRKILGNLIVKPQGKPTLVARSDKRPEMVIENVKDEFTEVKNNEEQ